MIKFGLIVMIVSQFNPLLMLGLVSAENPEPEWLQKMRESKIYSVMMIFFVGNALESTLISTGAFEIYANRGQYFAGMDHSSLIWSKLAHKSVPQPTQIIPMLDEMMGKPPGSENFQR